MVLLHSQRVMITHRQERLKVFLDVMGLAKLLQAIDHSVGVKLPIGRLGDLQVVDLADLEQVSGMLRQGSGCDAVHGPAEPLKRKKPRRTRFPERACR
jgi:hypothetical protein